MKFLTKKNYFFITALLVIFIIGVFLRFYNYSERITIDADSSRDAFVAWSGAENLQLPLVGPFISIAPATTGPWYWWQIIFATIIIPSKLAPWLYLGILSSALILIAYYAGVLLEGKLFGLLLAFFVAFSPQQIKTATQLTNPSLVGFFSFLTIVFFLKIFKQKPTIPRGILLGFFLGITINIHYQAVGLLTLLPFLLLLGRKNLKLFLAAIFSFGATFIPLLFFELNNHWFNMRHIIEYWQVGQYKFWTSTRWLTYAFDFWPRFVSFMTGGNKWFSLSLIFAIALIIGIKFFKKNLSKELIFLIISFLIQVVMIRYYRGEKFFGYLQFFHPYVFIFVTYVFWTAFNLKPKPFWGLLFLTIYIFFITPSLKDDIFSKSRFMSESQKRAKMLSGWTGGGKFTLYRCREYDTDRGKALYLISNLWDQIDENSKNKIGYLNGVCQFPRTYETETLRLMGKEVEIGKIFPKNSGELIDFSVASTAAILNSGWIPLNANEEYKSAARWWFTEQP